MHTITYNEVTKKIIFQVLKKKTKELKWHTRIKAVKEKQKNKKGGIQKTNSKMADINPNTE